MRLVGPLRADVPEHWRWVPELCARAYRFTQRYETHQDGRVIVEKVQVNFVAGTGQVGAWVGLDDDDTVVGHLLAWTDTATTAFIAQAEADRPLPNDVRAALLASVAQWARGQGMQALEAWVRTPAHVRLYRRYGWTGPVMYAVRAPLEGPRGGNE